MKRVLLLSSLCAAGALIASCSQSQTTALPAATLPRSVTSWAAPRTSAQTLLYVSNGDGEVTVYNFAGGALVSVLTGFQKPMGLCSDRKGDVYIADSSAETILEYAHGGTEPIQTLDDAPDAPYACSIDPKSGDLAVANNNGQSTPGDLAIWTHASGTPTKYTDTAIFQFAGCAYDSRGNLLISGFLKGKYATLFAWMAHGSTKLTNLVVPGPYSNRGFGSVGIGWDGRYFTIDDDDISRILVTHGQAYYAGRVSPTYEEETNESGPYAFYYQHGVATMAIAGVNADLSSPDSVNVWNYPAAGSATISITHGVDKPFGVALSLTK
jgi:hypothetical protein